jgi:hypothetical protein
VYRRTWLSVVMVVAVLAGLAVTAQTASAAAPAAAIAPADSVAPPANANASALWPEAYYWIKARHSGKVITNPTGAGSGTVNLVQQGLSPTTNGHPDWQLFRPVLRKVDEYGRQWYTFHRMDHSHQCIRTLEDSGYPLHLQRCDYDDWHYWNQIDPHFLFTAHYQGDGYWSWMGWWKYTTWDVSGSSQNNGAPILTYGPHGQPNQQFMLYRVRDADYIDWNYSSSNAPEPTPPKPDFQFIVGPCIKAGEQLIYATFKNVSTAAAGAFRVALQINNGTVADIGYTGMAGDATQAVSASIAGLSGADSYNLVLDQYNTVDEENEYDNSTSGDLATLFACP